MNLKQVLSKKLTKKELAELHTSFDVIGSKETGAVAIIEIPDSLKRKKKSIGNAIIQVQPNVKSVLWKKSERQDQFRLREYELIAGDKSTEVIHKENGIRLVLDPQKVFFSPREGTERAYIASLVKPKENVMIFFAGCGPYVIQCAKKTKGHVYGIEINPDAFDYMSKNITINKVPNALTLLGDVRDTYKNISIKFDRIALPLAKHAHEYTDEAIQILKKGGIIHFYHTGPDEEPYKEAIDILRSSARRYGRKVKILDKRLMSAYASRVWKVVIDAKIE